METDPILISAADIAFVRNVLDSGTDFYRAYDRLISYVPVGSDRYFWLQQASIINQAANGTRPSTSNNLSSTYIIAHSTYGLALDGLTVDLRATSNAIARNVLEDVFITGTIRPLGDILADDIGAALSDGHQTIAGWGGSFYYWDLPHPDGNGTVGSHILGSAPELEKFLLSSTVATLAVVFQELGETPTFSEILTVVNTAAGAGLSSAMKTEIATMTLDAVLTGQIIADVDNFGQWTYDRTKGEFYYIIPQGSAGAGERVVATGAEAAFLEERRAFRLDAEVNDLDLA